MNRLNSSRKSWRDYDRLHPRKTLSVNLLLLLAELVSGRLMVNAAQYEKIRAFLYRKARIMKGGA